MAKRKHRTTFQRSNDKLEAEGIKQCTLLYGATALALSRHWDKGKDAIARLFDTSGEIWHECASTNMHSMVELCERETGIEIQCGDGKSWHDLPYMNAGLDVANMNYAQWAYMRQQQCKWVAPQVMACIMLSLHRKYGFGYKRCARIYRQIQEIESEYSHDSKKIRAACIESIHIDIYDTFTKRREAKAAV